MRICRHTDFQMCKMRMVLRIFLADVTGKMWTQCYNLKKHVHFTEIVDQVTGNQSEAGNILL